MILNISDMALLKPVFALLTAHQNNSVIIHNTNPEGRRLTLDISAGGIYIKAEFPDSSPAIEFYRYPQGLALAYGLSIKRILNQTEGE